MRHEKRRSTAALQNASEKYTVRITATFWSAALLCRFRFHGRVSPSETPSSSRDFDRDTPCRECRRRVVRHENQKSFRAGANTDSQASEEESNAHSIARTFAETKESFSDSVSDGFAKEEEDFAEPV